MKKWISWAVVYLVIVIAGYNIYDLIARSNDQAAEMVEPDNGHGEHSAEDGAHGDHTDHGSETSVESDVDVQVRVTGKGLNIYLTDLSGNPIEELEVNHEKLLHLIIVDDHLDNYYHLHPSQIDVGVFQTDIDLPDGAYKAFVDILPVDYQYQVTPISFKIGEVEETHEHGHLTVDTELTKVIDGKTATLDLSSMNAGEAITLTFTLPDVTIEPYLGAMGHVVILDEEAENYLHVHPLNDEEPIFETSFDKPGIYKIWAEFQINGEVYVFPYTVEIE